MFGFGAKKPERTQACAVCKTTKDRHGFDRFEGGAVWDTVCRECRERAAQVAEGKAHAASLRAQAARQEAREAEKTKAAAERARVAAESAEAELRKAEELRRQERATYERKENEHRILRDVTDFTAILEIVGTSWISEAEEKIAEQYNKDMAGKSKAKSILAKVSIKSVEIIYSQSVWHNSAYNPSIRYMENVSLSVMIHWKPYFADSHKYVEGSNWKEARWSVRLGRIQEFGPATPAWSLYSVSPLE